jgi:hypothetical protein
MLSPEIPPHSPTILGKETLTSPTSFRLGKTSSQPDTPPPPPPPPPPRIKFYIQLKGLFDFQVFISNENLRTKRRYSRKIFDKFTKILLKILQITVHLYFETES